MSNSAWNLFSSEKKRLKKDFDRLNLNLPNTYFGNISVLKIQSQKIIFICQFNVILHIYLEGLSL